MKGLASFSIILSMLTMMSLLTGCCSEEPDLPAPDPAYAVQTYSLREAKREEESNIKGQDGETEPPLYEPEEELIDWGQVKELETEDYYIVEVQEDDEYYGKGDYYGGGTGYPNYIYYYEVRIDLTDLQEFMRVEPWGE